MILELFRKALSALYSEPKLFLPNLLAAVAIGWWEWTLGQLLPAFLPLAAQVSQGTMNSLSLDDQARLLSLTGQTTGFLAAGLLLFLLTIYTDAMYPGLLRDYYAKKSLSYVRSLKEALGKTFTVVPAVLLATCIPAIPFALLAQWLLPHYGQPVFWLIIPVFLAAGFLVLVLFYAVLPASVLSGKPLSKIFSGSFGLARHHPKTISVASLIPFSFSIVGVALPFFPWIPGAWVTFWIVKVLTGLVATFHLALNPTIYLEFAGEMN